MAKTLPDITLSKDELMYIKENLNQYHSGCEGIIIKGEDPRIVRKIFLLMKLLIVHVRFR